MRKKLFSEIPYLENERIVLKRITDADAGPLQALVSNDRIYRYLPTFLFERKYPDIRLVIDRLYTERFRESIILGIFEGGKFCGLAEMYGFKDQIHKISVGYRLLEECWGRGLATDTLKLMVRYLCDETDIEIITASSMIENRASARVLTKNGFTLVETNAPEDWGFDHPVLADKWIA